MYLFRNIDCVINVTLNNVLVVKAILHGFCCQGVKMFTLIKLG
jgi:hypothetical protein